MSNTSKLLFKVFGNEPIVEQFDKHHKFLKAVKWNQNRESYKDCLAQLEIKLICTEDNLKKELQKMKLKNFKNNKSLSLLSNNTAGNSKMINIILKLKTIKKFLTDLEIWSKIILGYIYPLCQLFVLLAVQAFFGTLKHLMKALTPLFR